MKIWLDSTNLDMIQKANHLGLLYGVTTNPDIVANSGRPLDQVLADLLKIQSGPVAAQVVAHDRETMLKQAQALHHFSKRIIVKIPVSEVGLEVIHELVKLGIATMATTIFHPQQALMAALAGAQYVAPYIGQMEKNNQEAWSILALIVKMFANYSLKTQILAASIPTVDHFLTCAEMGIPNVTVKDAVFNQLITTETVTQDWMSKFSNKWEQANLTFL